MKKIIYLLLAILVSTGVWAQGENNAAPRPSMKENWDAGVVNTLKENGGIYVVIVVIAIIISGFFWYMWRLDKKISRLENDLKK